MATKGGKKREREEESGGGTAVADPPAGEGMEPQYRTYDDPDQVVPWANLNPRTYFDPEKIEELAASIEAEGILQNIVVHPSPVAGGPDLIVAGESRWRAVQLLKSRGVRVPIPARVQFFTHARALKVALLENIKRASLPALDEARGLRRYQELTGCTQADLAEEFFGDAKKQPVVANRLRLLELPDDVQELVAEGRIEYTQARNYVYPLLRLPAEGHGEAFAALVARVRDAGGEGAVSSTWLAGVADDIERAVRAQHETACLFGANEPAAPPPPEAPTSNLPTDDAGQTAYLLRAALTVEDGTGLDWSRLAAVGATDQTLEEQVRAAVEAQGQEERKVDGVGSWSVGGGTDPRVTVRTRAAGKAVHLRTGDRRGNLLGLVREAFGIGQPTREAEAGTGSTASAPEPGAVEESVQAPAAPTTGNERGDLLRELVHLYPEHNGEIVGFVVTGATDAALGHAATAFLNALPPMGSGVTIPGAGTFRVIPGQTPSVNLFPAATGRPESIRGPVLLTLLRAALGIPHAQEPAGDSPSAPAVAAPAAPAPPTPPHAPPAPPSAPAAPAGRESRPAPPSLPAANHTPRVAAPAATRPAAPAAAPIATLPPPGSVREPIPADAGWVTALYTVLGGRPGTFTINPLPDGRIAFTAAPRVLKTGERPFALTLPLADLDGLLIPALDAHFTL